MRRNSRALCVTVLAAAMVALSLVGCAGSGSAPASASSAAGAPAMSEVEDAIKELVAGEHGGFEIAAIDEIGLTRDARGRRRASAHLQPPACATNWPAEIVIRKAAGQWRVVSFQADRAVNAIPTPVQ
jgi:outer membrane lipoprotein SlyB